MGWFTGCPARMHREGATRMSSANGDSTATLHSLPSSPTKPNRNGPCQAPALPDDAERLSAIIATQQEIATAGLDLGTVMTLVADRTQALTGAAGAAVVWAEGDEMVYRAASGTAAHCLGLRLKRDASLSGRCVRSGQALRCDDADTDERVDRRTCRVVGLRSMIAVPLLYDRRAVGVLKVLSPQPGAFGERDVQTLQLMAGLIAAALSHAAAYEVKQALVEERTGALRQSEERLRPVIDQAPAAIAMFDRDMRYLAVSRRWLADYDLTGRGNILGKSHYEVFPEIPQRWREAHRRGLAGEIVRAEEDPFQRADGTCQWLRWEVRPWHTASGEVGGIILSSEEITTRKQAQEALRQSEARIRSVLHNVIDGIITIDEQGVIETVNPAVERLFGYTGSEVVGQNVRVLMPDPYRSEHDGYLANYLRTGHAKVIGSGREVVGRRKDGSTFPMDLAVGEFREGGRRFFTGVVRDITERKKAENKLLESEQRLAAELEAITRLHALSTRLLSADNLHTALDDVLENAIVTSGADFGNIQLYDPQAGALEIVAQRGFRQDFLDYFRRVRVDEGSACAQAMRSGQRIIIEDVELAPAYEPHRRIAAAAGYRAVQSTPLKSRNGSVLGMLSTHFRLPQRVSARNPRLLDLYARYAADRIERIPVEQALRAADRRKDEFLAMLAHELRNPLAPIRNAVQVLKLRGPLEPALQTARDMIDRQVGHMVRLVDDLLDVSRISRGKINLRCDPVELATVVASAVEGSRPLIDARRHDLQVDLPAEPVRVKGDLTRLAQVVLNLLNNSAKYTPEGGHIRLAVGTEDNRAVLWVRDDGVGIAPELLPKVFDLFTQAERTLDRSQGGLGIGLTLVKKLTEMHGGTVEAHSAGPGRGSELVLRLPLLSQEADAAKRNGQGGAVARGRSAARRILVVDDNKDAADSLV